MMDNYYPINLVPCMYPPQHALHAVPVQSVPMPRMNFHPRQVHFTRSPILPQRAVTHTYYDYLVVVDFEATCEKNSNNSKDEKGQHIRTDMPEIIQFPAILVDVRQMKMVDYFDSIVKPVKNPILSDFCVELTGITQEMVDSAPPFTKVLRRFERWLKKNGLNNSGQGRTFALVCDGSFDMGHFLYKQCIASQLPYPTYAKRWVNIRTIFQNHFRHKWFSLKSVLSWMGAEFEGRPHNGLDDAKNISRILIRLIFDGCIVYQTEMIVLEYNEIKLNDKRLRNDDKAGKWDLATVRPVTGYHECMYFVPPRNIIRCSAVPAFDPDVRESNRIEADNKENFPSQGSQGPKKSSSNEKVYKGKKKHSGAAAPNSISLKASGGLESAPAADQE